jgi:hypothetical protein
MIVKVMSSQFFAFWRYDHSYPYILGGSVTKMYSDGRVETKEYGPGTSFMPIKLLPLAQGKVLMKKIKALAHEESLALIDFHADWRYKLEELVPFAKKI